jgi:two-component system cell cycle response regulator CpdR
MARILIAEDDDSVRAFLEMALSMEGHDITLAFDGAMAFDVLNEQKGDFDLLLTDIQMPVMDGIALALSAARDFPELTILMMTGYAHQRERAFGLDKLVHDVVSKPFSLAQIRESVQGALKQAA